MNSIPTTTQPPFLFKLLSKPLVLIPNKVNQFVSAKLLNQLFKAELKSQELDFLEGKVCLIEVRDIPFKIKIYLWNQHFVEVPNNITPNITMNGESKDFIALVNQQEDPDTLFFQRRLRLSGDTELGLHLKNFLDALEWEQRLPRALKFALLKMGAWLNKPNS